MTGLIEQFSLPEHEKDAAGEVKKALKADLGPFLRTSSGLEVAIPPELAHIFEVLADAAQQGQQVSVSIGDPRLRPREAAAELGMSRTYLCALMDAGELASPPLI